ncbi:MAG: DUF1800 domain-containing protein [Deltaproteobacteria bacterium]|nr:DUF1800 domain-containing protein [Deltaproteobacteria bacterium]
MREVGDLPGQYRAVHALNRLGFGPRPGDVARLNDQGIDRYIHEQLHPESIPIPEGLVGQVASYRTLHMTPMALFREFQLPVMQARRENRGADPATLKTAVKDERVRARIVMREAVEARLLRAIQGPRQLQEVMTAFWFNHFNVFAAKGLDNIWTGSFEETAIRPHTLGRFRALLGATARHPAMLFYLDNWQNSAPHGAGSRGKFEGLNENYARELMELHTMGVNGGYTQQDVIALAHILTGWGLPKARAEQSGPGARPPGQVRFAPFQRFPRPRWLNPEGRVAADPSGFYFDASRHDFGPKIFLGRHFAGSGIQEGEDALDMLARHPATAHHLSYQLAQYFVADDPPKPLVERMALRFLETDGEIREVLAAIFASPEFWDRRYYAVKFKSPYEYIVSSVRAANVAVRNYRPLYGTMQLLGMPLYGCQTPNGYSNTRDAWLNPDAMMTRLSFATALGSGNLPLDRPPFEEDESARGAPVRPVVSRNGGADRVKINYQPEKPSRMAAPDATVLVQGLGGPFSASTRAAIEAAPAPLHAALVLGSPEFMMR